MRISYCTWGMMKVDIEEALVDVFSVPLNFSVKAKKVNIRIQLATPSQEDSQ